MLRPRLTAFGGSGSKARGAHIGRLLVARLAGEISRGKIVVGSQVVPCSLGRSGVRHGKREGDGGTPAGSFGFTCALYRADRLRVGRTRLPIRPTRPDDGWCDDPRHPSYNRPVRLPFSASHERLWRPNELYDVLVVLDHNLRHPTKGRGSAIFLHVTSRDLPPTAGCVAVRADDLRRLLPRLSGRTRVTIQG